MRFSKQEFFERFPSIFGPYRLARREDIKPGAELFYINPDRYGNLGGHHPVHIRLDEVPIRRAESGRELIHGIEFDDAPFANPKEQPFSNDLEGLERDDSSSRVFLVRK